MKWLYQFVILSFAFAACSEANNNSTNQDQQPQVQNPTPPPPVPQIELVINIGDKELYVLRENDTLSTYPVAVGTKKYPTPTGEFKIHKIDWNPDWTPPDSEWSEDEEYMPPGHKDNPMGRARIVYQMPYTIHGTKELESLGNAESHGSVRMANTDVIELAKLIMKESGTEKPADWYDTVLKDSTKMVSVDLMNKIKLTNKN